MNIDYNLFTKLKKGYYIYKSGNYITLTIYAGALKYMPMDASYEVFVYTVYMNNEYSQRVQIRIAYEEQTPFVFLELSFYFYHYSLWFLWILTKVVKFLN